MSEPIRVRHSEGEYFVEFVSAKEIAARVPQGAFVITDENVERFWRAVLPEEMRTLAIPPGEKSKCLHVYGQALRWLAASGCTRDAAVVALGGGVVGDLAGFVSATYMRGIAYVQVPTTLVAQVDSSVGGKVGIDLPEGKNLAGAFYPPERVIVSVETLRTLPDREFRAGLAEVWKYGFILDETLMTELEARPVTKDAPNLEALVRRCVELKRDVVEADERERGGLRAILNFGHTVGHAIERVLGYGVLLHGEAIAIGMCAEARIGERLGVTERGTAQAVEDKLSMSGLETALPPVIHPGNLLDAMRTDKKSSREGVAMSLLVRIGECKLVRNVREEAILAGLFRP